jgi:uncharacterized protein
MILETLYLPIETTKSLRRIQILLPDLYYESKENYRVLYMHDGQNLFKDSESYSGISWGIDETLCKHHIDDLIVVGIDNSDLRKSEYSPWKISKKIQSNEDIGGLGDLYTDFLIHTVKPMIDQIYRTKVNREDTLLAGSSLGALISCYIGSKYPNLFGIIGSFSLASWFNEKMFLSDLHSKTFDPNQKYFISVGRHESSSKNIKNFNEIYLNNSLNLVQTLKEKGIKEINHIITDDIHHESAWRTAFESFILWINKKV